ncbi:hypothetical protein AVEN_145154-1 [Araneus ventricosus]|uniref:Uncharacterized protein n=1 Tax=Araneus ventricosus TaxID=182803 RepID=A0A4Y2PJR1_ARAVE|nr:hypothetical protein AVEN_145154-1 [Araneus ventricosus]
MPSSCSRGTEVSVNSYPARSQHLRTGSRGSRMSSIQTLNWPTCTSHMELLTVTGAPLCVNTRNFSRKANVPQSLRRSMQFQHDTNDVRQHLHAKFEKHWICRGGPVQWPARSPYLSCLDFFC